MSPRRRITRARCDGIGNELDGVALGPAQEANHETFNQIQTSSIESHKEFPGTAWQDEWYVHFHAFAEKLQGAAFHLTDDTGPQAPPACRASRARQQSQLTLDPAVAFYFSATRNAAIPCRV